METIAIILHLLHYVLALLAVIFCIILFRHHRQIGWLLICAVFLEPFVLLVMRAVRGRPLLPYRAMVTGPDGIMHVGYRMDFSVFYIVAVVGLFLLVWEIRRDRSTSNVG